MFTKAWGPYKWISEHYISLNYPNNPTTKEKQYYNSYYSNMGNTLPCILCKDSYNNLINNSSLKLNDAIFTNRNSVVKWVYDVHEFVNDKLDMQYFVLLDEVKKKYENNNIDFISRDCSVIPSNIVELYMPYIQTQIADKNALYWYSNIKQNMNYHLSNKDNYTWKKRNINCRKYLNNINYELNAAVNNNGLPSQTELMLMLNCSSSLGKKKLMNMYYTSNYFDINTLKFEYNDKIDIYTK